MDPDPIHARVRAGDPDAFRQLFTRYSRLVYGYASRATGDLGLAEDIVSLTFLEAWRLRARLRAQGETPRPWLMGIAVNVTRNVARARRRHREALARLPPPEPLPDFTDELVGRMADAERLAAARAALARLRPAEREVFMLCAWSGLSYAEAASALGVRVGTVRSRLSRTRHRLRRLTEEELARPTGRTSRASRPGPTTEPRAGGGQQGSDRRLSAVRSSKERHP